MLRIAPLLATLLVCGLTAGTGRAQPAPKTLEDSGIVKTVDGPRIEFDTLKNGIWWVQFGPESRLHVEGTAELSYLRPGLMIRFNGEFDKKNVLAEEVKEIEVFTPQGKNAIGFFADSSADKPVRNPSSGTGYEIRGKLSSLKDNDIVVAVGSKKVSGKLSDDVVIKINVEDPKDIASGDSAKLTATYLDAQKPTANAPGMATADDVVVTLQRPLAGLKKKGAAKAAKSTKEKKDKKATSEPAADAPLAVSDPFGVDGQKDEMQDDKKPGKKKKPAKDEDDN